MRIDFGTYFLEPEVNNTSRWNLYKNVIYQSGKNKGKERQEIIAYAVTIPRAVELMSSDLMADDPKVVTMNEFLGEYKKVYERFRALAGNNIGG